MSTEESIQEYVRQQELAEARRREAIHSRDELGLGIADPAELRSEYVAPDCPRRMVVCPVDGSKDCWAALELAFHMALDPSPPGPFHLYILSISYFWSKFPGSHESKLAKANKFAESLQEVSIHRLQEFEKKAGKKVFYRSGIIAVVGDKEEAFEKEYKSLLRLHDPDPDFHLRIVMGERDPYAEAHSKKESDLVRRMFKVASPNTELIVVDAQTNSIVRVSKNLESKYRIPTPLPTREEAIARALDTAANLQGMPRMQVEQPVIAIESVGAQGTEMELKELEREFDRAITGKANAES